MTSKHCPSCTCERAFYMTPQGIMWERVPNGVRFVGDYRWWLVHHELPAPAPMHGAGPMRECQHCHLQIRYDELMGFWEDIGTQGGDCQENPQAMSTTSGGNMNVPGPHEPIPSMPTIARTPAMEATCADLDYFQWRHPVMYDGDFRLLVPHSDPQVYEESFNFIWRNEQQAREGLEDWGVEEDAREEHWILVHYTGTIVGEHV